MESWATAADLADLYRVSPGTIRSWASRDHWRRTSDWPRRYAMADAQASYEKRHQPQPLRDADQHATLSNVSFSQLCPDARIATPIRS